MPKVAIVAALESEVAGLTRGWSSVARENEGRGFIFFERDEMIVVCGGIGEQAARRAAEAVIALYHPALVLSVGFVGALDASLSIGDILAPSVIIDARDGSRVEIDGRKRNGILVTFMAVAGIAQKANLAQAYGAHAVDMEGSAVAAAARAHGIPFDAVKVISDAYDFEMPAMANFIDPQGRFRTPSFALFVALRPWLWPRVAQLGINSRKAAKALAEHLERFRQELSQTSVPAAEYPEATAALTSAPRAGGRE